MMGVMQPNDAISARLRSISSVIKRRRMENKTRQDLEGGRSQVNFFFSHRWLALGKNIYSSFAAVN